MLTAPQELPMFLQYSISPSPVSPLLGGHGMQCWVLPLCLCSGQALTKHPTGCFSEHCLLLAWCEACLL